MLYVVATPIGNLSDLTLRALQVLKGGTLTKILCEDTRTSKKLMQAHDIHVPLESFHAHTSDAKIHHIVEDLVQGQDMALISDAGTPGISDPGTVLIKRAIDAGVPVVPIPGAAAFLTALMASGLPTNTFYYAGYLPAKKGRETLFRSFAAMDTTVVMYESKHRLMKTMEQFAAQMPDRKCVVAKELTKQFERFLRGTTTEVYQLLQGDTKMQLGEFVLILAPISWQ